MSVTSSQIVEFLKSSDFAYIASFGGGLLAYSILGKPLFRLLSWSFGKIFDIVDGVFEESVRSERNLAIQTALKCRRNQHLIPFIVAEIQQRSITAGIVGFVGIAAGTSLSIQSVQSGNGLIETSVALFLFGFLSLFMLVEMFRGPSRVRAVRQILERLERRQRQRARFHK